MTDPAAATNHQGRPTNHEQCRKVSQVLALVGNKWSVLVVMLLDEGPRRFSQIKRMVEGVSQRMLTLTLRGLERDGLVTRTVYPTIPPKVEYALTPLGRSLSIAVKALGGWVMEHLAEIDSARVAFDQRAEAAARPWTGGFDPHGIAMK